MAVLSVAIGLGVAIDWHPKAFLALAVVLNLAYCVLGQGFGGILTGSATDPNAGVLFILLAAGLYSMVPIRGPVVRAPVPAYVPTLRSEGAGRRIRGVV